MPLMRTPKTVQLPLSIVETVTVSADELVVILQVVVGNVELILPHRFIVPEPLSTFEIHTISLEQHMHSARGEEGGRG